MKYIESNLEVNVLDGDLHKNQFKLLLLFFSNFLILSDTTWATIHLLSLCAAASLLRENEACSSAHQTDQEIPFRIQHGIVQPSAAATPSARTSSQFQAVIVQTQFLYTCIKDCVWTSLLGMNVNVGGSIVTMFDVQWCLVVVFGIQMFIYIKKVVFAIMFKVDVNVCRHLSWFEVTQFFA